MRGLWLVLACAFSVSAHAEEGMWTFDNFPAAAVKEAYGADISQDWLDHVRLATVRLAACTASFVSPDGLILTNHHCIEACLAQLSDRRRNLMESGFMTAARFEEQRCVSQHADVLVATENVTDAVLKSVLNLEQTDALTMRRRTLARLEQACEQDARWQGARLKCQAVTLYQGAQYVLYKYRRYEDVRLVFAPEQDTDNFQFPRWSLDFAFLRVYEHGWPVKTPEHLRIKFAGPAADDLVLVAGHPGSTARLQTLAQLEFERSVTLPNSLTRSSELRGQYLQWGRSRPADGLIVEAPLNQLQNLIKVRRFELEALNDPTLILRKSAEEQALRSAVQFGPDDPWAAVEAATRRQRAIYLDYSYLEQGTGFNSALFRDARWLLRAAEERDKPAAARLREYAEGRLPALEQELLQHSPVSAAFEQLTLAFSLERLRESLGPDHPVVRRVLGTSSPEAVAAQLIQDTRLADGGLRRQLWMGGRRAIDASHDAMIELARAVDPASRAVRQQYEQQVEAPIAAALERIAAARLRLYGNQLYPDATFTLRINYGRVQGWVEDGVPVAPFTLLGGVFEHATGTAPFRIPERWLRSRDRLDPNTPFCLSSSNDISGGNSGSALVDAAGDLVGLVFDGNAHSVAGRYWMNSTNNRAIALHPAILHEALDKVYGAHHLLAELAS